VNAREALDRSSQDRHGILPNDGGTLPQSVTSINIGTRIFSTRS
jgi:hypothetical protein